MPIHVIAKKDSDNVLDTVVFHAGEAGDQEAVAVFTNEESAQRYLNEADWEEPHEPVDLAPFALLQWLQRAYGQGVKYLAVDPKRQPQIEGEPQAAFSIESQLTRCADALVASFQKARESGKNSDRED